MRNLTELSDEELAMAYINGQYAAFDLLFTIYVKK